jgi:hypothetical protein
LIKIKETRHGFSWGPLEVTRSLEDPDGDWVVIHCGSKKRNVEVFCQSDGDMRIWIDGIELIIPRPMLGMGGFN